jgi:two-component system, cell cycle sensor histidine kinase and response regulator CckA
LQTVLVVDDEPLVVTLISRVLTEAGFHVVATSEPKDALKICQHGQTKLDLLLTDLMMPGMNGRELRDKVAEVRPDLPVTYMSGYADSRACELMGTGAVDVLLKPFGVSSLLTAVTKGVNRNTTGDLDGVRKHAAGVIPSNDNYAKVS